MNTAVIVYNTSSSYGNLALYLPMSAVC